MIILIDYEMLNQSCIPGITPARAYHIIILYTIWFHFFKWKDLKASPQRINIVSMWQDVPYHVTEEIKMKMRYHYTSIRITKIVRQDTLTFFRGTRDIVLIYFLNLNSWIIKLVRKQYYQREEILRVKGRESLPSNVDQTIVTGTIIFQDVEVISNWVEK